ncbi:hypothetical protein A2368_00030 [Candidatus Collierbacteria bacterium RIFOXYB1_FULL_49_13]|uniref:DUF5667 domain-containing protein n=1 Tax=Candidatus Collierbacteria bacterium RIFOXYB1_FULL_49_13 TaxID=1817728 RepID=A0A1F5FFR4_9BACT|nr:MAG: hypothetical protein A2368_00030 [Candidatus Collierbacteria bacterium RIFOXYB1_FULL_49_13]
MHTKSILLLVIFFFSVTLFVPQTSNAVDLQQVFTSENSIVTKIQEGIEYFFAFKLENKVAVLEKQAEKRLTTAQGYAQEGNQEKIQNLLQNYLQIKERQNTLLGQTNDKETLERVAERTIEQQKTMEEIKTKISGEEKQNVIEVQEQVVNQVAKQVIDANGSGGATEFLNEVKHVWAPGTGPGGEAGVVIEGGEMKFAPGTSAGGPSAPDIKTVEIKTGGAVNDPPPVPDGPNYAPGTSGNSPGNTINSGGETANPGTDNPGPGTPGTWLAP